MIKDVTKTVEFLNQFKEYANEYINEIIKHIEEKGIEDKDDAHNLLEVITALFIAISSTHTLITGTINVMHLETIAKLEREANEAEIEE